jgi:hypothetical protein
MTRWNKGSEVIERLLEVRHLEHVPADADTVAALIATARRHVTSAATTAADDPEGGLTLAYDAARKTPPPCSPIKACGRRRRAGTSRSSMR